VGRQRGGGKTLYKGFYIGIESNLIEISRRACSRQGGPLFISQRHHGVDLRCPAGGEI
jgi:hypothetical protein